MLLKRVDLPYGFQVLQGFILILPFKAIVAKCAQIVKAREHALLPIGKVTLLFAL